MSATPRPRLRLALLISGGGRTMENLAACIDAGRLDATIEIVISSREAVAGIDRAKRLGLPAFVVPRKAHDSVESFSDAIFQHVRAAGTELVCLCGFLSLLAIPPDYGNRVVNIHPALLPAFGGKGMYGHHVHEAVLAAGCKVSGCTVHFANAEYDKGPIIVQRCCPVEEHDTPDTLAARVFDQECVTYPQAIQLIAEGRVTVERNRTRIAPR